jgi:hypothetical protein
MLSRKLQICYSDVMNITEICRFTDTYKIVNSHACMRLLGSAYISQAVYTLHQYTPAAIHTCNYLTRNQNQQQNYLIMCIAAKWREKFGVQITK